MGWSPHRTVCLLWIASREPRDDLRAAVISFRRLNTARFELTNVCNLRCRMCGIWEERPNLGFGLDLYERVLQSRTLRFVKVISLTGGEPFALRDFGEYFRLARRHHRWAHINISTNGWYTDRTLAFLEETRPRNVSVTISWDGVRSHDSIRRVGGSAARLLQTAKAIRDRFPEVWLSLKMTVTNDNHEEILESAEACRQWGIPFRFKTLEKLNCHQSRFPSEIDGPDYAEGVTESITAQAREVLALDLETNSDYIRKLVAMNESAEPVPCSCSPRVLFLGVDGKVFLCRRKDPIGSLASASLDEIWQSASRARRIAEMAGCQDTLVSLTYTNA